MIRGLKQEYIAVNNNLKTADRPIVFFAHETSTSPAFKMLRQNTAVFVDTRWQLSTQLIELVNQ